MKKLVLSTVFIASLLVGQIGYATEASSTSNTDTPSSSTVSKEISGTTDTTTSETKPDALGITKSDIFLLMNDMVNEGKLSQFQYEGLISRLEKATTVEEATLVYSDAIDLAKQNKELYQSSFDEKVYNTKYQLELLVKAGRLTQKQADEFVAKVDSSKTIEELDAIWAAIEKAADKTSTLTTSSSTVESSTTESSKKVETIAKTPNSSEKQSTNLPKTGEKESNVGLQLSAVTSLFLACVLIKRKSS
ncbi:hypothetical protein [Vagococcus bubulae]|uniref:Gram-positive cocci surface proteins LPxTG domain-containing protein n=1 Tax=Vagococcus bubulae TaxID=1977868 RepID=A0A429ZB82_9ENTE|nr:hypothetical protein [Vagococcus bubulae]RST90936.1 hypothetical protein CBF36_10790 [Vagococcus bubulae]